MPSDRDSRDIRPTIMGLALILLIALIIVRGSDSFAQSASVEVPVSAATPTPVPNSNREVDVTLSSTSLGDSGDLASLLEARGEWRGSGGQFAKVEIRFESLISVSKIELTSCHGLFVDGADLHVNFDHTRVSLEGGQSKFVFAIASVEKPIEVRSLVFNFRHNTDVCLKDFAIFNGSTRWVLRVPNSLAVTGTVPTALFDSRPETTWYFSQTGRAELKFASEVTISRLRIWNGDQRGAAKFRASPRVKALSLTTQEYKEKVVLVDAPGPQVVELKAPFRGTSLNLSIDEAYGGSVARAKVAEIQFGDGKSYFAPDVRAATAATAAARRSGFQSANLGEIMDGELNDTEEDIRRIIRVRSDGTIFIRGQSESLSRASVFSFLGQYMIVEANTKRVRLKLEGVRLSSPSEMDSSTCVLECAGGSGTGGMNIEDEISFGRSRDGAVFVRDEGPRRATGLDFRSYKARILRSAE